MGQQVLGPLGIRGLESPVFWKQYFPALARSLLCHPLDNPSTGIIPCAPTLPATEH